MSMPPRTKDEAWGLGLRHQRSDFLVKDGGDRVLVSLEHPESDMDDSVRSSRSRSRSLSFYVDASDSGVGLLLS